LRKKLTLKERGAHYSKTLDEQNIHQQQLVY